MDPKFTQSFIPQKPLIPQGRVGHTIRRRQNELAPLISVTVFVIALLGSAGAYGYQQYLLGHIKDLDSKLKETKSSLDSETIDRLTALDGRLKLANSLLLEHVSTTALFELLQSLTLQNVQFTDFNYTITALEGDINLEMGGKAKNYTTLVLQSDVLAESEQVKRFTFSDIDLDSDGNVVFKLSAVFDKKSLLYKDSLQSLSFGDFPY